MRKPVRCIKNVALFVPAEPGGLTREDVIFVLKLMGFTLALAAGGVAFVIGRL